MNFSMHHAPGVGSITRATDASLIERQREREIERERERERERQRKREGGRK